MTITKLAVNKVHDGQYFPALHALYRDMDPLIYDEGGLREYVRVPQAGIL